MFDDAERGADTVHPLGAHVPPLVAALTRAVDDAAGSVRAPCTLAGFDQHEKACSDVEDLVLDILAAEREAGALAYIEATKW